MDEFVEFRSCLTQQKFSHTAADSHSHTHALLYRVGRNLAIKSHFYFRQGAAIGVPPQYLPFPLPIFTRADAEHEFLLPLAVASPQSSPVTTFLQRKRKMFYWLGYKCTAPKGPQCNGLACKWRPLHFGQCIDSACACSATSA